MNRKEFEQLRALPGKRIEADIEFLPSKNTLPNLTFDSVRVENNQGWDIILNGTFKPALPAVTFNFVVRGVGPICRLDVNGTRHVDAGRTHKHELARDDDPRLNLPNAIARPDISDHSPPRTIWEMLCKEARIDHVCKFVDPD